MRTTKAGGSSPLSPIAEEKAAKTTRAAIDQRAQRWPLRKKMARTQPSSATVTNKVMATGTKAGGSSPGDLPSCHEASSWSRRITVNSAVSPLTATTPQTNHTATRTDVGTCTDTATVSRSIGGSLGGSIRAASSGSGPMARVAIMSREHPAVARFRDEHTLRGGTGRIILLPESVHTAALAAEAIGCEVGAIANSLLFDADGSPVLILTSGGHRVDTEEAAAAIGVERLRRATPEFVRDHTGQVIGGVSPIGHPAPVPTYLDLWLRQYDEVWAAAGHPAAVFSTSYDELLTMTGATEIDVDG